MPTKLTGTDEHAVEGSTYTITAGFTDENGDAVTPNEGLTYTLTDNDGTIIHSLEDEDLTEASSVDITLSGDALGISAAEKAGTNETFVLRVLTVEGTYDSDLGNDLPLREQCTFMVDITVVDHDGN